ncbi:exosome complex protein Rrp42 [Methanococcoides sp. AM1]|uniref:exosome complex protein Rrp42 n=1 Tax=Methanococcoides sp. AM1 TaxID=1201011 RepID=UPI0010835F61|nr:exosome complex protein Rrp42 [Methanococcoides sp. AM1]
MRNMSNEAVSRLKKDFIFNLALKGQREDGRAFDEMRDIKLETNVIDKAEGSAKVCYGDTQVIVGVKLQVGTPFPDSADKGVIITSMELNPIASPDFEAGPPRPKAIEMARVVDRGIRESGAIDLNKLCITEGEEVWMVFLDVHVLNDSGNLLDAASLGAIAALMTATIPAEREGRGEDTKMPIREMPVSLTFVNVGGEYFIDASNNEESICDTKVTIVSNQDGSICAMQKSGAGSLSEEKFLKAVEKSCEIGAKIREEYLLNI